ncbi:MAG TPA: DUF1634 domain-containing protein [Gemmatimonadales bacterium]|nr:DUF1634 domain-containing protein [Gemmatimonadales bacterium]
MKLRDLQEPELDQLIGRLLQLGVLIATIVVLLGAVALLIHTGSHPAEFHVFRGAPAELRSLTGIVTAAAHFNSQAIVQLGLVLLILTPTARVAFTLGAYIIQRDRLYIVVTLIVLVILLYGLLSGQA